MSPIAMTFGVFSSGDALAIQFLLLLGLITFWKLLESHFRRQEKLKWLLLLAPLAALAFSAWCYAKNASDLKMAMSFLPFICCAGYLLKNMQTERVSLAYGILVIVPAFFCARQLTLLGLHLLWTLGILYHCWRYATAPNFSLLLFRRSCRMLLLLILVGPLLDLEKWQWMSHYSLMENSTLWIRGRVELLSELCRNLSWQILLLLPILIWSMKDNPLTPTQNPEASDEA